MFGFFKRSNNNKKDLCVVSSAVPTTTTSEPDPVAAPQAQISMHEIIEIVDNKWTSNASCSVFFAQCGGFNHQVIGFKPENIVEYNQIILRADPNSFNTVNKLNALDFFKLEAPKDFQEHCKEFEPISLAEAMFKLSLDKREADMKMIISKIDEKFEFIGPIFQRLFHSNIDKYGEVDWGPSFDEVEAFVDRFFTEKDFDFYYRLRPLADLLTYIEDKLESAADNRNASIPFDGIEFEHWTANEISKQGWQVQVSQASGDQGVDVIARRDGCSVAIQCKRYSQPVGNKAVQEIFAAKKFASTDRACVIATGGFTRSARELAASTGVVLFEAEAGLKNFSSTFGFAVLEGDKVAPDFDFDDDAGLEFNFDANNEARKAIIKSFFAIASTFKHALDEDEMPYLPDSIVDNFDPVTGEGSAKLEASELITLLVFSDLHLSGKADMTDGLREQFCSSDVLWQKEIGEDKSALTVKGILGYCSTTPVEIKDEFRIFWDICEMFVGFDSNDPYKQALNEMLREKMEENRPKILDDDYV
jgi:hypothetical protein